MSEMTPQAFIEKWHKSRLKESAAYSEHFCDLCHMLGLPTPAEADPSGEFFTFQKGVTKNAAGAEVYVDTLFGEQPVKAAHAQGFADVWLKDHFAWEYKGKLKDLEKAREQLLQYLDDLQNPPLLVVCDFERFEIHTRFNNCVKTVHRFTNEEIGTEAVQKKLRALFENVDYFKPTKTTHAVTEDVAKNFAKLAELLRNAKAEPHSAAHFLMKLLFCLFAEDVGLLPNEIFTKIVGKAAGRFEGVESTDDETLALKPRKSAADSGDDDFLGRNLRQLFRAMKKGGEFWGESVDFFNGGLFDDDDVFTLDSEGIEVVNYCCKQDWSSVEPSIFGTLFERSLDPSKRSQLGAHYTSKEDIVTLVEPVLMQPLRREWEDVKATAAGQLKRRNEATGTGREYARRDALLEKTLKDFAHRLSQVVVLDPACGSGNFLYVSLNLLKELEKDVITLAAKCGYNLFRFVSPEQLFGIELNPYAAELARLVVWIGHIQWDKNNGLYRREVPILTPLKNIKEMDAILEYVEALFELYHNRVEPFADLCCYWFEKARFHLEDGKCKRAGLLATQSIRGGVNRDVLKRTKESGDIFFAISDQKWILEGAHVRISMIGFDNGSEKSKILNGAVVSRINANLATDSDIYKATTLISNRNIGFKGPAPQAPFDITSNLAIELVLDSNPSGVPNSDVLRPVANARDIAGFPRGLWTLDFALMPYESAILYEKPFKYCKEFVFAARNIPAQTNREWWQYERPRGDLRKAVQSLPRIICTPRHSKHRVCVWMPHSVLCTDANIVFARDDDCFFWSDSFSSA